MGSHGDRDEQRLLQLVRRGGLMFLRSCLADLWCSSITARVSWHSNEARSEKLDRTEDRTTAVADVRALL